MPATIMFAETPLPLKHAPPPQYGCTGYLNVQYTFWSAAVCFSFFVLWSTYPLPSAEVGDDDAYY